MNFDPAMTKQEHIKHHKDGLAVWDDIFRFAKTPSAPIPDDDLLRMRWFGIYRQKPNDGHFMWRIKLPGGRLTPSQLREIGLLANQYGRGFADITTRQDIQLHWLTIHDFPDALDRIYNRARLYTDFACGDTPRNITSCPLDGVVKGQIVQLGDLVQRLSDMFRDAGAEFSNLPRKFKPAVAACPLHCHLPQINDISTFAVLRHTARGEQRGLGIMVGGGLSSEPHFAQSLRVFIPDNLVHDLVPPIFRVVAAIFRDADSLRYKRGHARLKFLVAENGWQWFRDEIERRLGHALEHDDLIVHPVGAQFTDHMGVGQQLNGLCYVGVPVSCGRWTADQMIAMADLAQRFAAPAQADLRLSHKQNLLLLNIPPQQTDQLCRELDTLGLPPHAPLWRHSLVSCTGKQFCNLAVVETKDRARAIIEYLEEQIQLDVPLMLSVSGCHNSCAQHHIADIGLTGIPVVMPDGEKVDGFNVLVGGHLGENPGVARLIARKVPAHLVHKVIASLVRQYIARRLVAPEGHVEPFRFFASRIDDKKLAQWCMIPEWMPPQSVAPQRITP